ncbi:hypothetical protein Tco_1424462 [Tanacetum coccineum]
MSDHPILKDSLLALTLLPFEYPFLLLHASSPTDCLTPAFILVIDSPILSLPVELVLIPLSRPTFILRLSPARAEREEQGVLKICSLKSVNSPFLLISLFSKWKKTAKFPSSGDDPFFTLLMHIDVIDEILEEDFDALLDEGSKILNSIEGILLEEEIFSEFDEFIAMTADENYEFKSDTKEPPFEKITINTDYKIKTSLEEPPTDLELKPLPDNLEYVFLEEPSFLHVIISSKLSTKK